MSFHSHVQPHGEKSITGKAQIAISLLTGASIDQDAMQQVHISAGPLSVMWNRLSDPGCNNFFSGPSATGEVNGAAV